MVKKRVVKRLSTNTENLNDRIKEVRKALNMSQKEVAKEMGVSQGTISWSEQPGNNVPKVLRSPDKKSYH